MKRLFPLFLLLAVAGCSQPAEEAAPAPAAAAPAPAAPAAEPVTAPEPVAETPTEAAVGAPEGAETPAATDTDAAPAEATDTSEAETPAAPAGPAPVAPDPANAPREGTDYTVLPTPQPTFGQGGIEVAEVFAYTCIHCANLQPSINTWKPGQPTDVRLVYVPGAFGGASDNFARGFYAAEAMGLLEKTHDDVFQAFFVRREFTTGSLEEVADYYATQGADRDTFLSTMNSFAVTAKVNRARQFALRTNVQATPTVIINGKYSATMTGDRGADGLLATIDWLVQKERYDAAQ